MRRYAISGSLSSLTTIGSAVYEVDEGGRVVDGRGAVPESPAVTVQRFERAEVAPVMPPWPKPKPPPPTDRRQARQALRAGQRRDQRRRGRR